MNKKQRRDRKGTKIPKYKASLVINEFQTSFEGSKNGKANRKVRKKSITPKQTTVKTPKESHKGSSWALEKNKNRDVVKNRRIAKTP